MNMNIDLSKLPFETVDAILSNPELRREYILQNIFKQPDLLADLINYVKTIYNESGNKIFAIKKLREVSNQYEQALTLAGYQLSSYEGRKILNLADAKKFVETYVI